MILYVFLSLARWPLVCRCDNCAWTPVCMVLSIVVALFAFMLAQLVRELWLLRALRGYS